MPDWDENRLQREYLTPQVEENQHTEYKAAAALAKTDGKKKEVTKDVSAFANADGGILIYGIKETSAEPKKPLGFDPIDPTKFSKEWLGQVINNITPRVPGLLIHPVEIQSPGGLVYVVEIPKGTTAHQATDFRYHRRWNFEIQAMPNHEVQDVMHRSELPEVGARFVHKRRSLYLLPHGIHEYDLSVHVVNVGSHVVKNYKLDFQFPNLVKYKRDSAPGAPTSDRFTYLNYHINSRSLEFINSYTTESAVRFECRSRSVLFPGDREIMDKWMQIRYGVDQSIYGIQDRICALQWTLYADNMPKKTGEVPFRDLNDY